MSLTGERPENSATGPGGMPPLASARLRGGQRRWKLTLRGVEIRKIGRHFSLRAGCASKVAALILTVALLGPPSGARAAEFSREVVVGDAKIGIVFESGAESRLRHGILTGIASVTDGRVSLADHLVSLTVLEGSSAGSAAGGTVLPWEEAEPLLGRVLANQDSLDSVPVSGEADLLGPVGQRMYLPRGLVKSARLASAGTLDLLVRKRNVRCALYKEAALRAVALDQARRFDERLERTLASWSGAAAMLGAVDSVASSGLDAHTQLRIIAGTRQAAQHLGRTGNIAGKVASRVSRSGLGRAVNALGILGVGVELAQGVVDQGARNRLLGEAAEDALVVLGLEDARRLLRANNADRAMIDGLADAIAEVGKMSQSRLERYKRAARSSFERSAPAMVGVVAGTLVSGGAGLVVREALGLSEELAEHVHGVMGLSALTSLAFVLRGPIEALIHDGEFGGASAKTYAVRELVGLHHRLSAEATATVYNMLWKDRFGGGLNLGGFGRGFGLTVAEWLTDDGRTEKNYKREVEWRIGRVRDGAAFGAKLPETLAKLQRLYAGSIDFVRQPGQELRAGETRVFDGMEFVWIPAGEFRMGSTSSEAFDREQPVTRVRISRGFWLGKHEVTRSEWREVMGSLPHISSCGRCPVEDVSWNDTQQFIDRLNGQATSMRYRLPTEAEWEYAARAGTNGDRYGGNLDAIAWCGTNPEPRQFSLNDPHSESGPPPGSAGVPPASCAFGRR